MTPTAFCPCCNCPVISKETYRAHLSYFVHPGSRKLLPTLSPLRNISKCPSPETYATARFTGFWTANSFRNCGSRYMPVFFPFRARSTLVRPCNPVVIISSFLSFSHVIHLALFQSFSERSPMPNRWIRLQGEGFPSLSQLFTFQ